MIDENLIIEKLESLKVSSKKTMGNNLYMKHEHLVYFLDLLIEYINSIKNEHTNLIKW